MPLRRTSGLQAHLYIRNISSCSCVLSLWDCITLILNTFLLSLTGPIICIEDDDDDQHLVSQAIEVLDFTDELCFFSDGKTALEFLRTTPKKPFLILCDIDLPLMNGIELRQCLNEDAYLRKKSIPFLFITSLATPSLVEKAYDATVQGYFRKPHTFQALKEQLRLIITYWRACIHPNSDF